MYKTLNLIKKMLILLLCVDGCSIVPTIVFSQSEQLSKQFNTPFHDNVYHFELHVQTKYELSLESFILSLLADTLLARRQGNYLKP
jgi:hypothetical protein